MKRQFLKVSILNSHSKVYNLHWNIWLFCILEVSIISFQSLATYLRDLPYTRPVQCKSSANPFFKNRTFYKQCFKDMLIPSIKNLVILWWFKLVCQTEWQKYSYCCHQHRIDTVFIYTDLPTHSNFIEIDIFHYNSVREY